MNIFSIVFFKIISMLFTVAIGFAAGRFSNVERDSIASLLFYFIAPIVFFAIPASVNLTFSALSITLISFSISSCLCVSSYFILGKIWQDEHRNILALSSGTANAGYFMLPIASALFDEYTLSIYLMGVIGINLFEMSLGFYMGARTMSSALDSVKKVVKLPILNAFIAGCIMSSLGFTIPDMFDDFVASMRGSYSILGMIMIGLGLSSLQRIEVDWKFTAAGLALKFIYYPLATCLFILCDYYIFGWYDYNYYNALVILSVAPMAANIIVVSSILKFHPEKVAMTVLLSSIFSLIYTPIMLGLLLRL